jgi:hypothetical protein
VSLFPFLDARGIQVAIAIPRLENLIALGRQTDLLAHLAMKRLEGRLSFIHSPLRELPGSHDLHSFTDQKAIVTVQ